MSNCVSPKPVAGRAETGPSRPVAELSASFPKHALIHEIEVRGGCDWGTLISISRVLNNAMATLESFAARRYGRQGERITCRVRGLDDGTLEQATASLRRLPGVEAVSVVHLLSAKRGHADGLP